MTRTLTFEGVAYPDGAASDPKALGWMQGNPPPPDRVIRYQDDNFMTFPRSRWALAHIERLVPTRRIGRSIAESPSTAQEPATDLIGLDPLGFTSLDGKPVTWRQCLDDTYTDAIAVMHRGRLVYERYLGLMTPSRPHLAFSLTKSYVGTLAAWMIAEGCQATPSFTS